MAGSNAESPVGTVETAFTLGVPTVEFRFTLGVVVPKPVSRGRNKRAEGASVGATAVGAIAVGAITGAATVGVVRGSTVTWITDRVGSNNMVTVALACLNIGLRGDNMGKVGLNGSPKGETGPTGIRDGNIEKGPQKFPKNIKGLDAPIRKGNWAPAVPPQKTSRPIKSKAKKYLFI